MEGLKTNNTLRVFGNTHIQKMFSLDRKAIKYKASLTFLSSSTEFKENSGATVKM